MKIGLWTVFTVATLLIVVFIAERIIERKVPPTLQAAVKEESKGIYEIRFKTAEVNLFKGQLIATEIQLIPDTMGLGRLQAEGIGTLFEVTAKKIDISGFGLLQFLWSKELHISNLLITEPLITRFIFPHKAGEKKSLQEQLQNIKNRITISETTVQSIQYRTVDMQTKQGAWLKNIDAYASNISLGQRRSGRADSSAVPFVEKFRIYGKGVTYLSSERLYRFQLGNLVVSSDEGRIRIDSFAVLPKYTEAQWSKSLKYKQDRYDLLFPKIEAFGVGFNEWLEQGSLGVDSLVINHAVVRVYADKGMPEKTTMASNNFPALAFQRLKLPITIGDVFIRNTDVYYKELNPKSGRAGLVFFKNLNANFRHVSNDKRELKRNPWVSGHLSTYFLGKPKLTLDLHFNMSDRNGAFTYKGALEGAPAPFYNQLLEPITLARAEKGYIKALQFNIKANRYGADVETEMYYNDLKVAALDVRSGKLEKKGVLSLFINWLAIKTDNPSQKNEPARIARHYYEHPQENTFFNLMWKALYSGLKRNLGLPEI